MTVEITIATTKTARYLHDALKRKYGVELELSLLLLVAAEKTVLEMSMMNKKE